MTERPAAQRLRTRRRRRRMARGLIKTVFWALVLAGVFVLGLGYGATISAEDEVRSDDVTITQEPIEVQATLPTQTETVTKTVTVKSKPAAKRGNDGSTGPGNQQ